MLPSSYSPLPVPFSSPSLSLYYFLAYRLLSLIFYLPLLSYQGPASYNPLSLLPPYILPPSFPFLFLTDLLLFFCFHQLLFIIPYNFLVIHFFRIVFPIPSFNSLITILLFILHLVFSFLMTKYVFSLLITILLH